MEVMAEVKDNSEGRLTFVGRWWAVYMNNRRRLGSVLAMVVALVLAWHVVTGRNGITSWQKKRAENKSLGVEIQQLTDENSRLSEHVDRLRSDPGAIEHEARSRFGYARPNEKIWSSGRKGQAAAAPAK